MELIHQWIRRQILEGKMTCLKIKWKHLSKKYALLKYRIFFFKRKKTIITRLAFKGYNLTNMPILMFVWELKFTDIF